MIEGEGANWIARLEVWFILGEKFSFEKNSQESTEKKIWLTFFERWATRLICSSFTVDTSRVSHSDSESSSISYY